MRPAEIFTFTQSFLALPAAGGNAQQVLNFDASAAFVWMYASYLAVKNGAATGYENSTSYVPPITILMTPSDTSSQLMNAPVMIPTIFGVGAGNIFPLPTPREFPAKSSMTIQVINLDTTITYDLYLSLIGVRRFLS